MSKIRKYVGNPLGDLRAEADHAMLDAAFYTTADYLSLIESSDKVVIVGRRGSGKSALVYQLSRYWSDVPKTRVIPLLLDEDQVIGLNPILELFGDRYRLIRAGCSIAWRYCLIMEITDQLATHYRFDKIEGSKVLGRHLKEWRASGTSASGRIRATLRSRLSPDCRPEERVGDLSHALSLSEVERAFDSLSNAFAFNCVLLIDKLDEGYEPTDIGVGFVDGIVDATITISNKYTHVRASLFLRDNMFRTIAKQNPDFSRNIEGQVLRLHWSEYELLNMICNRLRVAFALSQEDSLKVWNRCAAKELAGNHGFKTCLQLTLYRPRDILVLLNEAFYEASKENREQIVLQDVSAGAKTISQHRLDDLHKEYSAIFPGLMHLTGALSNRDPEFNLAEASESLESVLSSPVYTAEIAQEFAILGIPFDALRALYGIGFVGIRNDRTGVYVFCHDGKSPDREIMESDTFLIHPCYWMAMNLTKDALAQVDAKDIHDEYDIAVKGGNAELREKKLNGLISELGQIPEGDEHQNHFEDWCYRAIQTVFAGALRNVDICDTVAPLQRKNVVALNLSLTEAWKRVLEDYDSRQVLFALHNVENPSLQDFQVIANGLSGANGNIVFFVTREQGAELHRKSDLDWVRKIWDRDRVAIIKLPAKILANLLGKLRNPQKHDAVERHINGILDMYSRSYLDHKRRPPKTKVAKETTTPGTREPVPIDLPSSECYGELAIGEDARLDLMLFKHRVGEGRRPQVCPPVKLGDQAYRILEAGIENARKRYITEKRETAAGDGTPISPSECEPPAEFTYEVSWDQDDLASILHSKHQFANLQKKQKKSVKTAMSRLRNLVRFSDEQGLVTESDATNTRHAAIRFRYKKSG